MRITVDFGPNCILSDLIGDLNEAKVLRAGETHLFLAKVHFSATSPLRHVREASSDDLMTELQHDLGETLVKYITVRISYRHSGFTFHKKSDLETEGTTSHTTRLFTEATAVVRRHNAQSAWSPRTSLTIHEAFSQNPLIPLIERILPIEEARDAIKKLSVERPSMPLARRFAAVAGSSEETVKPPDSNTITRVDSAIASSLISPATVAEPVGPVERIPSAHIPRGKKDDIDPARRIWTEMRRHSRGHGHARKSISADHYFSLDSEPSRASSGGSAKTDIEIERERVMIMEVALRNKRSVGQETLRSFAPSFITREYPKQEPATISGLGIRAGRSWWDRLLFP